jgi:hypothetical protein
MLKQSVTACSNGIKRLQTLHHKSIGMNRLQKPPKGRRQGEGVGAQEVVPKRENLYRELSSPILSTARNASWGISTLPMRFIRFLPSFCFSSSLRLREISPP